MEKPLYKIVQCNLCDKEMTITHLARHMKEIHNTKRVKCYICPKSFKRKEKAINHLRNIHDIKMQDIKRNLLKEVEVPLPKNNKIKPRQYKRKMVKLRDGENFDGVLNSNQIHSEYIKDKILHDNTHDRRKYLNMTELEINLLRRENKSSQKNYSRSKSNTDLDSTSTSPITQLNTISGAESSSPPVNGGNLKSPAKRASARLSSKNVKREYREDDDEDDFDEDDDDDDDSDDDEEEEDDDSDESDEDVAANENDVTKSVGDGDQVMQDSQPLLSKPEVTEVVKPKRGRPRKNLPGSLTTKSASNNKTTTKRGRGKKNATNNGKNSTGSNNKNGGKLNSDDDNDNGFEGDDPNDQRDNDDDYDEDIDVDSASESSFKVTRMEDDSPQLPYDVFDKVRLVSFQISNEIGQSRLTLSFQFLTKQGKPLSIYLLREHEIKLFFMNSIPDEVFFERLNEIIVNIELLDNICVTNGEIITTENFGFRYKTFCWTTVKDFFKQ